MNKLFVGISVLATTAACAVSAMADVKVKSKQTVSGQSYESTTYIKGKRQRSESMGGMVNITQCDLKRGVQLNANSQTYMVTPFAQLTATATKAGDAAVDKDGVVHTGGRVTTTVTTKDTGERKQMFGHTARRLIITTETVSSPDACAKSNIKMQTDGWYIDAAFAFNCDYGIGGSGANYGGKRGCQDKFELKTVGSVNRGFPVSEKMTMYDENGREMHSMLSEVIEFSQATLDPGLFDIPAGYREVDDAAQMYTASSLGGQRGGFSGNNGSTMGSSTSSRLASPVPAAAKTSSVTPETLGPKKAGVIRIGIAGVKTGAVGEGIAAGDLAMAVQNSLIQHLKMPNVEVVMIDAKLDSAIGAEARQKECDFVAHLTAAHKKGGGGFGMFKALAPVLSSVVPAAGATGAGGYIAGQTIVTAASISGQVKNKDEISLDVRLQRPGGPAVLEKAVKAKAKSNGDDIITQAVAQAAQSIVDSVKTL